MTESVSDVDIWSKDRYGDMIIKDGVDNYVKLGDYEALEKVLGEAIGHIKELNKPITMKKTCSCGRIHERKLSSVVVVDNWLDAQKKG